MSNPTFRERNHEENETLVLQEISVNIENIVNITTRSDLETILDVVALNFT